MDKKASLFINTILASLSLISISVFFYALYRSGHHPTGHMTVYYAVSISGALFFAFVLLRCSEETRAKILLLVMSSILSIYALEIVLSYDRAVKPEQLRAKAAEGSGVHYDLRHRLRVWKDLRDKGINVYPLYNPYDNMDFKDTEILPISYISDTDTLFCNESGEFVVFKSDEYGFNNPDGLYKDNIDYALIGDSFTQGACVKREENIAGRLISAGRNVVNLGIINSGPPKELAVLKEYARPFRPKTVIWLFYEGNDHEGLEFEKNSSLIMNYLEKDFSQGLIHKQQLIDRRILAQLEKEFASLETTLGSIEEGKALKKKFNLSFSSITLPKLRKILLKEGSAECKSAVDPLFKNIMTEAKRVVDDWGGRLVFVYLPAYERYMENGSKCRKDFLGSEKRGVLSVIKELGIPVIDIEPVFSSNPDPLSFFPYRVYGHYNALGYMTVAKQIDDYLSGNAE